MEHSKAFYKFNTVISLMSLNKDNENYEIVKNNISELLNKIDNIKNNDEFTGYGELIHKDLTKEELKNINYTELLFHTLTEIHYFNKEYEELNDPLILNKMLEVLEKRKNIMIYNLTHTIKEQYKSEDLNNMYFNEYKPLYEKLLCNDKYKYGNLFKYEQQCRNELIKQYKQNDKIRKQ